MKKVIINTCFGGYNWSNRALLDYLDRANKKYSFWKTTGPDTYSHISREVFLAQDDCTEKTYVYGCHVRVNRKEFSGRMIDREDPIAIKLLEEKGSEYCSGEHSELMVVEYDDSLYECYITDYDGSEDLDLRPALDIDWLKSLTKGQIIEVLRDLRLTKERR